MKASLLLLLFSLSLPLSAQLQNYHPGYYQTLSGDTVNTEISQEGDYYFPLRVREVSGEVSSYPAGSIQGFGFPDQGLHYRQVAHAYTSEEGEKITSPRFALRLVDGANQLYRLEQQADEYFQELSDVKNHVYYLQRPSGEVYKLERVEEQSTQSRFRVLEKYRGALRYLFVDWPEVAKRTERLNFRDEEMAALVRDYNAFVDPAGKSVVLDTKNQRNVWHKLTVSYSGRDFEFDDRPRSNLTLDYSLRFRNALKSNSLTLGVGVGALLLPAPGGEGQNEWLLRVPLEASYLLTRKSKFRPAVSLFIIPTYGQQETLVTASIPNGNGGFVIRDVGTTEGLLFGMVGPGLSAGLGPVGINLRFEYPLLTALPSGAGPRPVFTFIGLSYELGRRRY